MNKRENEINIFLENILQIIKIYPDITSMPNNFFNTIYRFLEDYKVPDYEKQKDVSNKFNIWLDYFKNSKMNVLVDKKNLIFVNLIMRDIVEKY